MTLVEEVLVSDDVALMQSYQLGKAEDCPPVCQFGLLSFDYLQLVVWEYAPLKQYGMT